MDGFLEHEGERIAWRRIAGAAPTVVWLGGFRSDMAAGFEACYLSGAAMTASMGLPDLGIITVDEVCFFIRQVTRASTCGPRTSWPMRRSTRSFGSRSRLAKAG